MPRKLGLILFLLCGLLCRTASAVTPQITVSASAVTLLGSNQTISITATLIDPNQTGLLRVLPNIIPVFVTSTVTPGTTATVGPIFGTDVILDGRGNANTTVYKIQVFTVSNGIVASTPSLQNFFQFAGSGTVDLSTATPVTPAFFSGPSGSASILGTLTATQLISTVSTGTAPLVVASTTQVANLNASQLAGQSAPASAIVGVSDTQTLTNKTFDISANTLKTATNTAGHVPRNNGTQYVDAQLGASDLSDGVTGTGSVVRGTTPTIATPVINGASTGTGIQGTDSKLLTSGTVSGTGAFLCTDANGGATTSGCTAGGVSEATWASSQPAGPGAGATAKAYAEMILPSAHTLIRFVGFLGTNETSCATTVPVVAFYDETGATALSSLTLSNTGNQLYDSGALNVSMTAGHTFSIRITTAGDGACALASPSTWTAVYK